MSKTISEDQNEDYIAHRTLTLTSDPSRIVEVAIGRPHQEPEGEWTVRYQITGLERDRSFKACALDGIQALQLVMLAIGGTLCGSEEYKQNLLRWEGSVDLGFPVPESLNRQRS